ncbi:hypothetical protein [uncultured Dysgonomonas sp.]|uniref:hypothetical protein n=1 Tax=uncultured Dysgonomonas sp. TaxID=206096 RepID=UPI00260C8B6F|nr:hypothetical protein [uncultured Dysgonomonas sp.]
MTACIQQFLEAESWKGLGVIFSAILSALIIWQSFRISKRQRKLQEEINKSNEKLQTDIANNNIAFQQRIFEDNAKMTLYKYRTNCYLSVIEATDLFFELNIRSFVSLIQGKDTQLQILNELSRLKSILFKASHEARVLFSEEVFACYGEHRDLSIRLYNSWYAIMTDTTVIPALRESLNKILKTNSDGLSDGDIIKIVEYFNTNKDIQELLNKVPIFKEFIDNSQKLNALFHSNRIDTLVEGYIDVKNLGKKA